MLKAGTQFKITTKLSSTNTVDEVGSIATIAFEQRKQELEEIQLWKKVIIMMMTSSLQVS